MKIDIISVVPDLLQSPFAHSILKRAKEKGLLEVNVINLREFTTYARAQVDDYAFGGGAGMVMMIEPLVNAVESLQKTTTYDEVIFLTPDGETFNQKMANNFSLKNNLLLVCGHYKGIDQRIRDMHVTMEISIPGVLNNETSALTDSFQDNLLAPPVYTRPEEFRGWKVPEILLSGNHKLIDEWRAEQSLQRTKDRRPDLL